jgi:hypothetical protein
MNINKKLFFKKVKKSSGCWNWTARKNKDGYGQVWINHKSYYAHRISWSLKNGEIPKGMYILHSCDNPGCVNPNHLFLGTQADNVMDCFKKGKTTFGERDHFAKLKEKEVFEIRRLYKTGVVSQKLLSKMFMVSNTQINLIVRGVSWKYNFVEPQCTTGN